jgi:hypothetical protein
MAHTTAFHSLPASLEAQERERCGGEEEGVGVVECLNC